jgi:hypothetical protein
MSNGFFSHLIKLMAGTKARADDVNDRFDAIESGFDKLPEAHPTEKGFSEPVVVGTPTSLLHATTARDLYGGGLNCATDTGAANSPTISLAISPGSYFVGLKVAFKALSGCTGSCTLDVNGLGQKSLVRSDGSALAAGDYIAGQIVTATYDGTKFFAEEMIAARLANNVSTVTALTGTATTQAGLASGSAATASGHASTATTQASNASISAGTATTQADIATAAREVVEPANLFTYSITSTTLTNAGQRTLTVETGKSFVPGDVVKAYSFIDPDQWMGGTVFSYSGVTLVLQLSTAVGSGTKTNWRISGSDSSKNSVIAATQAASAAASAVTATTQAGLADTARINAETAETNAETAQGLAEDARDAALVASADIPKLLTSTVTVTVGSGGDYTTINEAITALCVAYSGPRAGNTPYNAVVNLLTGFVMSEQLIVANIDLSWIRITSVDATVTITRSSLTAGIVGDSYVYPAFGSVNGKLPNIGTKFTMSASGSSTNRFAVALAGPGASMVIEEEASPRRGFNGDGAAKGAYLSGGATLQMKGADMKDFATNLYCRSLSKVCAASAVLTGSSIYGAMSTLGGMIDVSFADCTGTGEDIKVLSGGTIIAASAVGVLAQTANTITAGGIIFQ